MAYVITQPCLDKKDRACVQACPVDCIYEADNDERMLFIHPDQCIECGACELSCQANAIFAEADVPVKWQAFIRYNRDYFSEPEAVLAELEQTYPPPNDQAC